jgi:hypothetical protein
VLIPAGRQLLGATVVPVPDYASGNIARELICTGLWLPRGLAQHTWLKEHQVEEEKGHRAFQRVFGAITAPCRSPAARH